MLFTFYTYLYIYIFLYIFLYIFIYMSIPVSFYACSETCENACVYEEGCMRLLAFEVATIRERRERACI